MNRTPLRAYSELDRAIGNDIRVLVKHENHLPTNSFKVQNGVSALTTLSPEQRSRGVVCGSRGNHGQGVAFAGSQLGIAVTVIVPRDNSKDKNAAMRGFGARVMEFGSNDAQDPWWPSDRHLEPWLCRGLPSKAFGFQFEFYFFINCHFGATTGVSTRHIF